MRVIWSPRAQALVTPALLLLLLGLVVLLVCSMMQPPPTYAGDVLLLRPEHTLWNLTCPASPVDTRRPSAPLRSLEEAVPCTDRPPRQRFELRGNMWVLYNYVPASGQRPRCWETLTLTTHGDVTFLGNLRPLVQRWRAPVSLALYAPGDDFALTLSAILWARACLEPPLVEQFVTFHMLFDSDHVPATVPAPETLLQRLAPDCAAEHPPWLSVRSADLYRRIKGLRYPVNAARNVAREAATTHYLLPSDVELVPSANLPQAFLAALTRQPELARSPGRRVFPLFTFEIAVGEQIPENKTHLVQLLREGLAAPFHERLCPECHAFPHPQKWVCSPDGEVGVSSVVRRVGAQRFWEPFYIGTHDEPLYDERLSWEGQSDKVLQSYTMCLMDYEHHVLDNVFLVHRPGVKKIEDRGWRQPYVEETQSLLHSKILPELQALYGYHEECVI